MCLIAFSIWTLLHHIKTSVRVSAAVHRDEFESPVLLELQV